MGETGEWGGEESEIERWDAVSLSFSTSEENVEEFMAPSRSSSLEKA